MTRDRRSALPGVTSLCMPVLCCRSLCTQWDDPNYSGTRISYDKQAFVTTIHQLFKAEGSRLVRACERCWLVVIMLASACNNSNCAHLRWPLQCANTEEREQQVPVWGSVEGRSGKHSQPPPDRQALTQLLS